MVIVLLLPPFLVPRHHMRQRGHRSSCLRCSGLGEFRLMHSAGVMLAWPNLLMLRSTQLVLMFEGQIAEPSGRCSPPVALFHLFQTFQDGAAFLQLGALWQWAVGHPSSSRQRLTMALSIAHRAIRAHLMMALCHSHWDLGISDRSHIR